MKLKKSRLLNSISGSQFLDTLAQLEARYAKVMSINNNMINEALPTKSNQAPLSLGSQFNRDSKVIQNNQNLLFFIKYPLFNN